MTRANGRQSIIAFPTEKSFPSETVHLERDYIADRASEIIYCQIFASKNFVRRNEEEEEEEWWWWCSRWASERAIRRGLLRSARKRAFSRNFPYHYACRARESLLLGSFFFFS